MTKIFDQNFIFVAKTMFANTAVTSAVSDVILMPQFLGVMRHHILGLRVFGNDAYFCSKFNGLSSSRRILKIG